jgi:hypothetical protein
VVVYLDTYKPYLCLILWIVVDGILCMVASIMAATLAGSGLKLLRIIVAVFSGMLAIFLAAVVAVPQFKFLAIKNCSSPERHVKQWTLVQTKDTNRGTMIQFVTLHRSADDMAKGENYTPWSLSPSENFHQCMGERWYMWPFFFWQPRRVKLYGRWPGGQSDLPLGELWRRFEREPFESDAE